MTEKETIKMLRKELLEVRKDINSLLGEITTLYGLVNDLMSETDGLKSARIKGMETDINILKSISKIHQIEKNRYKFMSN